MLHIGWLASWVAGAAPDKLIIRQSAAFSSQPIATENTQDARAYFDWVKAQAACMASDRAKSYDDKRVVGKNGALLR